MPRSTQGLRVDYSGVMTNEQRLERYLELCRRIYERMKRDGTWPWTTDSTKSDGAVESKSTDAT